MVRFLVEEHEDFPRQISQVIHNYPASHRQIQSLLLTTSFFASGTGVPRSTCALRDFLDRNLHAASDDETPFLDNASASVAFVRRSTYIRQCFEFSNTSIRTVLRASTLPLA
jgi:hypothetical protein